MNGEWVELIHKDFEFDFKGEPTGHYARGRVVKWYDNEFCLVELFCNGKRYKVSKQIVAHKQVKCDFEGLRMLETKEIRYIFKNCPCRDGYNCLAFPEYPELKCHMDEKRECEFIRVTKVNKAR